MKRKTVFTGAATAMVTPFRNDLSVNTEKLEELTAMQIEAGISALVVCGTTGEASTLTDEEQTLAVKTVVCAARHRVPVIAGVASNCTAHAVQLARNAARAGADALLVLTPYYNKTSQRGIVEHIAQVARAVELPVIIYNVPSRTGLDVQPETYLKLSVVPGISGIKEAGGNMTKITRTAAQLRGGLDLYSGSDELTLPILSVGGLGVISVLSNLAPQTVISLCDSYFAGDTARARAIQLEQSPLIDALFAEVNPIPIKYAMNYLGYNVGRCRLPLVELSHDKRFLLEILLKK